MTLAKTENYEIALRRISDGTWRVDPDVGLLFGKWGRPYTRTNTYGYIQVKFFEPGEHPWKERTVLAHRVIYESVHGVLPAEITVNHINGDHTDNRISNLEPMTQNENVQHAVRMGLYHANCWYCHHNGGRHYSSERPT